MLIAPSPFRVILAISQLTLTAPKPIRVRDGLCYAHRPKTAFPKHIDLCNNCGFMIVVSVRARVRSEHFEAS